jgi:hypothetical protein
MANAINLNNTTPAAPAGGKNVIWQNDGLTPPNVSAYVPGMIFNVDTPPASPSAYDDEFNSTTLNAKWTQTTSALSSYSIGTQVPGCIYCNMTVPGYYNISQPFPVSSGVATDVTVKCYIRPYANYQFIYLKLTDNLTPSNGIGTAISYVNAVVWDWSWWSGGSNNQNFPAVPYSGGTWYLHLQKTAANVWSAYGSDDGISWIVLSSNINSGYNPTINYLTLTMEQDSTSSRIQMAVDWVRCNWLVIP